MSDFYLRLIQFYSFRILKTIILFCKNIFNYKILKAFFPNITNPCSCCVLIILCFIIMTIITNSVNDSFPSIVQEFCKVSIRLKQYRSLGFLYAGTNNRR